MDQVVPFRVHGLVEKCSAPIYFGVPLLLGVHKEPRARTFWLALIAALIAVHDLTDWEATRTER